MSLRSVASTGTEFDIIKNPFGGMAVGVVATADKL